VASHREVAVPSLSPVRRRETGEGVPGPGWAGPGGSRTGEAGQGDGLAAQKLLCPYFFLLDPFSFCCFSKLIQTKNFTKFKRETLGFSSSLKHLG
jgi:hypothetical protein